MAACAIYGPEHLGRRARVQPRAHPRTSTFFPFLGLKLNNTNAQSRTAARKELLDQHKSPDECERLYEESLWCLYALQDDLLQKGNPFVDEDRETIATCACLVIT